MHSNTKIRQFLIMIKKGSLIEVLNLLKFINKNSSLKYEKVKRDKCLGIPLKSSLLLIFQLSYLYTYPFNHPLREARPFNI